MNLQTIYDFYKHQPTQLHKLNQIQSWFSSLKPHKFQCLFILGHSGIGKSTIINSFVSTLNLTQYDPIPIGKLFDLYESNNHYNAKDFIPKILKQSNVNAFDSNKRSKLIIIDSLEEFMAIQKTILKDIMDKLETIPFPFIIISETYSYHDLDKKIHTKLKRLATNIELESPNSKTMETYLRKKKLSPVLISKIISMNQYDLRNINIWLEFNNSNSLNNPDVKDFDADIEKNYIDIASSKSLQTAFQKAELDPFLLSMMAYENYPQSSLKSNEKHKRDIIQSICEADLIEQKIYKGQHWELLEDFSFYSTIYPLRITHLPKTIQSSSTLQKFMNTKKKNKKYDFSF